MIIIRQLRTSDRDEFLKLGADTAFFGAPIEAYFDDRNLFLDAFYSYYVDVEPGYSWVADSDGTVVGFLAGLPDTKSYVYGIRKKIIPRVLNKLLHGKYHIHKKTIIYVAEEIWTYYLSRPKPINLNKYPAHLHINLSAEWRNQGAGKLLMSRYLEQLKENGIPGVHLNTTSLNSAACRLYEKMGFTIYSTHPDRFWSKWYSHPVYDVCYAKSLD